MTLRHLEIIAYFPDQSKKTILVNPDQFVSVEPFMNGTMTCIKTSDGNEFIVPQTPCRFMDSLWGWGAVDRWAMFHTWEDTREG